MNSKYPIAIVSNFQPWDVTLQDIGTYQPIWDISPTLPSQFRPLNDTLHDPVFPCVFDNEATLTMRMDATIFVTIRRILAFIDDCVQARREHHADLPDLLPGPPDAKPLLMEHGAVAWCKVGSSRFLPDRCALPLADMYDDLPPEAGSQTSRPFVRGYQAFIQVSRPLGFDG